MTIMFNVRVLISVVFVRLFIRLLLLEIISSYKLKISFRKKATTNKNNKQQQTTTHKHIIQYGLRYTRRNTEYPSQAIGIQHQSKYQIKHAYSIIIRRISDNRSWILAYSSRAFAPPKIIIEMDISRRSGERVDKTIEKRQGFIIECGMLYLQFGNSSTGIFV